MHKDNNMSRRTRRTYEMHSKHSDYKKRIKEAQNNITTILESEYNPVIEYSGGKDSLVLLHMFMQQDNTVPVYNFHPGYGKYCEQIYRSKRIHNDLMECAEETGTINLTVDNTPFCRPNYLIGNYFVLLKEFMKKNNCNLEVLGIRGEENRTRTERVKGDLIRTEKPDRLICFPLRYLTGVDIWAYIISNDIKYPAYYDKMAEIYSSQMGWTDAYTKVRFGSMFNENNQLYGGVFDKIVYSDDINEKPEPGDYWWTEITNNGRVYSNGRRRKKLDK